MQLNTHSQTVYNKFWNGLLAGAKNGRECHDLKEKKKAETREQQPTVLFPCWTAYKLEKKKKKKRECLFPNAVWYIDSIQSKTYADGNKSKTTCRYHVLYRSDELTSSM